MTTPVRSVLFVVTKDPFITVEELNADPASTDEYDVQFASDVELAGQWASSPYVAAWVVHDSIGDTAAATLFGKLDELRNDVPFVYLSGRGELLHGFGTVLPDAVLQRDSSAQIILSRLRDLWARDMFSDTVVAAVVKCFSDSTVEFIADAELHRLRLRAGDMPVHTVNAVIPFCGPAVNGRLSVSASPETLQEIRRALLPNCSSGSGRMLEDLVGEISNRILGTLKRSFSAGGVELASGVPMMYTHSSCPVRYRGRNGSLLVQLRSAGVPLHEIAIGFALDSIREVLEVVDENEDDTLQTGAVSFL